MDERVRQKLFEVVMKFETRHINLFGGCLQLEMPISQVQALGELQAAANGGKVLSVEIKVKSRKRSLNANAYCWTLCEEIAKRLPKHTDEDVYRQAIRMVGRKEYVAVADTALEALRDLWSSHGIGWMAERIREARGLQECSTVALYYGSSKYDSKEMARLIDYLTDEAKELGCDIISEADRHLLIEDWGKEHG